MREPKINKKKMPKKASSNESIIIF